MHAYLTLALLVLATFSQVFLEIRFWDFFRGLPCVAYCVQRTCMIDFVYHAAIFERKSLFCDFFIDGAW